MVLGPEQSTALFRILQEILTNVARHAQATNVHIRLEQSGEHVSLQVERQRQRYHRTWSSPDRKHSACWGCACAPNSRAVHSTFRARRELEQRSPSGSHCIGQPMINILLADDHPYLRRGLVQILIDEFPGAVIGGSLECL